MKIYTSIIDISQPTLKRFWVAPHSDFKIGVKIAKSRVPAENEFTVASGSTELVADDDKVNGFTVFTISSGDEGFVEYTVTVDGVAEKFKILQIVTDSTVYEVDERGGDMSQYATKNWVEAEISGFVTEDDLSDYAKAEDLTAYATTDSLTAYATNASLTAYATKAELTDYVENTDLTAYYTKSETSSATELADAFAGAGGGGVTEQQAEAIAKNAVDEAFWSDNTVLSGTYDNDEPFYYVINAKDGRTTAYYSNTGTTTKTLVVGTLSAGMITASGLRSVDVGVAVTDISADAFFNNNNIYALSLPRSLSSIGSRAFYNCAIKDLVVPGSVLSIGNSAFTGNSLSSFTIENGVKTIDEKAFSKAIKDMDLLAIPDSVTSIGNYAFNNNGALSVVIGDGVTTIGEYAFYYNKGFSDPGMRTTTIVVGSSVTSIGQNCFKEADGNSTLTSIMFKGKTIAQVQAMANYPWGASTSIIHGELG